jgi:hypothetical protein
MCGASNLNPHLLFIMNSLRSLLLPLLFAGFASGSALAADNGKACCADTKACCQAKPDGTKADCCKSKDAACCAPKAAAAQTDYPLDTCVVSGEKLGGMGAPVDYIHQQEGQPDRVVRLCCKSCIPDFKKDPAKYLKLIDEAAAAKAKS